MIPWAFAVRQGAAHLRQSAHAFVRRSPAVWTGDGSPEWWPSHDQREFLSDPSDDDYEWLSGIMAIWLMIHIHDFLNIWFVTWLSYYKTPSRVLPMDNDRCRLVLMVGPAGSSQGTDPDRATAVVRWCLWCSEPLSFGAKMGHRSVVCSCPLANFKGAL